jgi:predicted enzyme related to lactoylglutathione lyase
MSAPEGTFIWYELMTTDPAAAKAFYTQVIGWGAEQAAAPNDAYTLFTVAGPGTGRAGLMAIPPDAKAGGARPAWLGYVAVRDVDETAARVQRDGGHLHRPPMDIPAVGRFAVVSDPQGALFYLFRPGSDEDMPPAPPGHPGTVGWHELHAADRETAFAFYAALFGWKKHDALDMGPMGIYQLFGTHDLANGGMMTKLPGVPHPFWLYYVNVADIDAASGRIAPAGGKILQGPHQVPGGSWIVQATDPQGALFAIVGPRA